jgi:hypothetical protein
LVKCKKCKRVVTRASLRDHHCGKVRCSTCQSTSNQKTINAIFNL